MPVEHRHFVEAALRRAFGGRAVVAEDVIDQRVVEDAEILDRIEQPADVMIGVLEKACVDLHLARENWLELRGHVVVGGDFLGSFGELRIAGYHAELLLACEGLFPHLVPTGVELALVFVCPLLRHVMRACVAPGAK